MTSGVSRRAARRRDAHLRARVRHDGVVRVSTDSTGPLVQRGFPWMTLPSDQWLAMGRPWHFFFAWVFVINGSCICAFVRHAPRGARSRADGADWRSIGASIRDHLRLRHPQGEDAKRYNVLQKLAYLIVIFVLLPLVMLMARDVAVAQLGYSRAGSMF